ncbi:MAG: hypothetical protein Q9165_005843 [Trypethelium subeluteriae]
MPRTTVRPLAQSPTFPNSPYIYTVYPEDTAVFAIASDDSLRCFSSDGLRLLQEIPNAHEGITCLKGWDIGGIDGGKRSGVATSGRDGRVKGWDFRASSTKAVFEVKAGNNTPLSALACNASHNLIAAGAEVEISGHEADIYIWDIRHPTSPLRTYTESHTDTITTLSFLPSSFPTTTPASNPSATSAPPTTTTTTTHATSPPLLLSGSTDALLTVFDPAHAAEDDAVVQVFNLGSAVHRAGVLGGQVWATSADEGMSFFEVGGDAGVGGVVEGEKGVQELGDVRELVGCRYVVDVVEGDLVVGDATRNYLAAYPIRHENGKWSVQTGQAVMFDGAHGEEIVRDCVYDPRQGSNGTYYTCGEDGLVKAWKAEGGIAGATASNVGDEMDVDMDEVITSKAKRRRKK